MTTNQTVILAAQILRFTLPFLVILFFYILFKDSNKQLMAFSEYSPLKTMAYLYGINNNDTFLLQYDNNLGRSSRECDICILDKTVSRVHARISYRDGIWEIFDLGSTSGTFVDNKKVKYAELKNGSVLQFGSSTYTFLTQARKTSVSQSSEGRSKK